MYSINPTKTKAWKALLEHRKDIEKIHLRDWMKDDNRFSTMHVKIKSVLLFDFSKHRINEKTVKLLEDLFNECKVQSSLEDQLSGGKINVTEDRSVLHSVLRDPDIEPLIIEGQDVREISKIETQRMYKFAEKVRNGSIHGYTGKKFKNIVNIGIGGSDLGPKMAVNALKPYSKKGLKFYFVSNIDGSDLNECLLQVDPQETLFIVASKTFTTQETMTNAEVAKKWMIQNMGDVDSIKKHFIAISTNHENVSKFGIKKENIFRF